MHTRCEEEGMYVNLKSSLLPGNSPYSTLRCQKHQDIPVSLLVHTYPFYCTLTESYQPAEGKHSLLYWLSSEISKLNSECECKKIWFYRELSNLRESVQINCLIWQQETWFLGIPPFSICQLECRMFLQSLLYLHKFATHLHLPILTETPGQRHLNRSLFILSHLVWYKAGPGQ